ncbi:MAG: amino acid ABC transporter substrate-binding protein [Candidatus Liberibacter europaeus]|uniref:Amino acid ABC transporter substrate-binding protein n=1 Tax=Candidatus Liberibacter europaeus TaxID=744859 RepID=A0A2T4VXF4_9HYPH|nr:MAG: amino acid ABC transporter substrate-binding protein [Candidatus Liberibacter europaeus]
MNCCFNILKQLYFSKYVVLSVFLCIIFLLFFIILGYVNFSSKNNTSIVLRVGTDGTYPPHSFHSENGKGELIGFDIDLIKEVANRLNLKTEFFETKTSSLIFGIDANRYDILVSVTITKERQKGYDFSIPYISNSLLLIVRNDEKNINSFNDLAGKTVAQIMGTNLFQLAQELKANLIFSGNFEQSLQLLSSGRTNATMIPDAPFFYFLKKNNIEGNKFKIADRQDNNGYIGFMMLKRNNKLKELIDKTLCEIRLDGTYEKIFTKYFGKDVSPDLPYCPC